LREVTLARQQAFADADDLAVLVDALDEVRVVLGVEPVDHLLIHDVEHEHVGALRRCRIDFVEHGFRDEPDLDSVAQLGVLGQQLLVSRERDGHLPVREQIRHAHALRRRGQRRQQQRETEQPAPRHRHSGGAPASGT
jgi:hypothetical protein